KGGWDVCRPPTERPGNCSSSPLASGLGSIRKNSSKRVAKYIPPVYIHQRQTRDTKSAQAALARQSLLCRGLGAKSQPAGLGVSRRCLVLWARESRLYWTRQVQIAARCLAAFALCPEG